MSTQPVFWTLVFMDIQNVFKFVGLIPLGVGIGCGTLFLWIGIDGLSWSTGFGLGFILGGVMWFAMGVGFGLVFLLKPVRNKRKAEQLLEVGMRIDTKFFNVELNQTIRVNGKSPYIIQSIWQDPSTGERHIFRSENIWYNPERFVPDRITVRIDPENKRNYVMDTSFLKKAIDELVEG